MMFTGGGCWSGDVPVPGEKERRTGGWTQWRVTSSDHWVDGGTPVICSYIRPRADVASLIVLSLPTCPSQHLSYSVITEIEIFLEKIFDGCEAINYVIK